MGSPIPQGQLADIVHEARARTGVPAVAAGLSIGGRVEVAADGCAIETPFRIASITKLFTASLATLVLSLDPRIRRLLSHTADLHVNVAQPLPARCRGLWSYSNAGYALVGEACETATGTSYSDAVRKRLLEPLGLDDTSFEEPPAAAPGHLQDGSVGQRLAPRVEYPVRGRAAGGLWSTVADLLRFAAHQLGGPGPLSADQLAALREPQAEALGARYCLGCWRRELDGERIAYDHEGSVGGYQSLLLVIPADGVALAVLTNSWRGSGLTRRVVRELGLVPASYKLQRDQTRPPELGRFALGSSEAVVDPADDGWRVTERATDPLTRSHIERPPYTVAPLVGGVYGAAGGLLMTHRVDFPRADVARVGWVALPRADA